MRRFMVIAALGLACTGVMAQQEESVDRPVASALPAATPVEQAPPGVVKRLETGIASWYGKRFHGRKTASGEAFDMDALTAAHPKLPFGSWVRVRDLVNGRSVDVRINDRGPHLKRRVIDLSLAAAKALGVQGTHKVEILLLDTPR